MEATVLQMPVKTKLVCSECGAPGEGTCRCGAPYVTPSERAAAYVEAHPEMSDRAIAAEIGVSHPTVGRARRKATGTDVPVKKRVGKDGKARKRPKPRANPGRGRKPNEPTISRTQEQVLAAAVLDQGKTLEEVACDVGLKSNMVPRFVVAREQGRREILDELSIDPETLAPSAKAKLDIAKRMLERKLNAEHAARMRGLDEEVRQRLLKATEERLAWMKEREEAAQNAENIYRQMTNDRKIFTVDQFRTILMCLHPDGERTAQKLSEAFRLFNGKRLQLTGEK